MGEDTETGRRYSCRGVSLKNMDQVLKGAGSKLGIWGYSSGGIWAP